MLLNRLLEEVLLSDRTETLLRALEISYQPQTFLECFLCEQVTLLGFGIWLLGSGDSEMRMRCGLIEFLCSTKGDISVTTEVLRGFYFVNGLCLSEMM